MSISSENTNDPLIVAAPLYQGPAGPGAGELHPAVVVFLLCDASTVEI